MLKSSSSKHRHVYCPPHYLSRLQQSQACALPPAVPLKSMEIDRHSCLNVQAWRFEREPLVNDGEWMLRNACVAYGLGSQESKSNLPFMVCRALRSAYI